MITSKSKAIETDCRGLLVYIKLLCDCTRITWLLKGSSKCNCKCEWRKILLTVEPTLLSNQQLRLVAMNDHE